MKKIIMCGNHPKSKGGMTSVIEQILKYDWSNEKLDLNFISTYYPGNNFHKIIYFIYSFSKIIYLTYTDRPDLFYIHMSYKGSFYRKYIIQQWCKINGIKVIIHLHGSEFYDWYKGLNEKEQKKVKTLLRECDTFVVLGKNWEKRILAIEPETNIVVINNGVEIPHYQAEWNDDKCTYLFLGVLIPRKGIRDLLEAVLFLKKHDKWKNKHLIIAGTGSEEKQLKKICAENNLEKDVTFSGWIDGEKKDKILRESQVMILPSYNEGLPISILEAIALGLPVISTNVGDIPIAIENNSNGYIITPGNVKELASKIELLGNKEKFISMSTNSKKHAEKYFSENIFYENIKKIIVNH